MAGRPPGVRTLVKAIAKLSRAQIRQLLTKAKASSSGRLERLELQREKHLAAAKKLERRIAKLSNGNAHGNTAAKPGRKGRRWKLSAETRRKMSEAAKRRYAGKGKTEATPAAGKRKRKPFSEETKAKMAAAQKARWAKVKGAL